MDRFTVDELERRVDEVLFYRWDPIGINDSPSARAEYRSYVAPILEKLKEEDKESLISMLNYIQVDAMGLESDLGTVKSIVQLLLDHKDAIDNGYA